MSTKQKPIPEEFQTAHLKKLYAQQQKKEQENNSLQLKINKAQSKAREAIETKFNQQKYVLGGDLKKRANEEQSYKGIPFQEIMDYMIENLQRDQDRKNFDLEPLPKKETSPAEDMKKATA